MEAPQRGSEPQGVGACACGAARARLQLNFKLPQDGREASLKSKTRLLSGRAQENDVDNKSPASLPAPANCLVNATDPNRGYNTRLCFDEADESGFYYFFLFCSHNFIPHFRAAINWLRLRRSLITVVPGPQPFWNAPLPADD